MRKRTRKGASWVDSGFVSADWRWARMAWGRDMGRVWWCVGMMLSGGDGRHDEQER
jgi:hypothetical protein